MTSRSTATTFQQGVQHRIRVRIGELAVAGDGSVIFTIGLGSCVAIALYDADHRIGGLAHAMLPHPGSGRNGAPAGRFASTAVPALIEMLEAAGAARANLRARLAGGASMFRDALEPEGLRLGRRNIEAAHGALEEAGIPLDTEEVLGTYGRSVFLRTTDGKLLITSVNRDDIFL